MKLSVSRHLLSLIVLILLSSTIAFGQQIDMKKSENMKPWNIEPGGMSGRITTIDVVISNPQIVYAGNASV